MPKIRPDNWQPGDPEAWKGDGAPGSIDPEDRLKECAKNIEKTGKALAKSLREHEKRREKQKKEDAAKGIYFPDTHEGVVASWEDPELPGLKFFVVHNKFVDEMGEICPNLAGGHYCGYVRFPERPVQEPGYSGIMTYVWVHGGLTFAEQDDRGMVYGFDCNHGGDHEHRDKYNDLEWMRRECVRMAKGIQIAAEYEALYLQADGETRDRAELLDRMHAHFKDQGLADPDDDGFNFGVMINLLSGDL
jgi:hypothetical protein